MSTSLAAVVVSAYVVIYGGLPAPGRAAADLFAAVASLIALGVFVVASDLRDRHDGSLRDRDRFIKG